METQKFTQFGTFSVIILLPILVFCLTMMCISGFTDPGAFIVLAFVSLTFVVCLLIFNRLTIYVNNISVSFRLGTGLVRKRYLISDIKSCRPVRNSPFYGLGIRMIPGGWLYSVSGLGAVELSFKNKKSVVRIGTDRPEVVSEAINRFLDDSKYEHTSDFEDEKSYVLPIILVLLIVVLPMALIIYGNRDPEVRPERDQLVIKGIYGLTIQYPDISLLDTIGVLPSIKRRTNGYSFANTFKGNFTLTDGSRVKLFIHKGIPPYIHVSTGKSDLYLNLKDPAKTRKLYKSIQR
ncbi:MAG: hypothetical protein Q8868_15255 [Bacteroidota bacterium]|nr:hypothetical protein [Bacteroidota bacterium]